MMKTTIEHDGEVWTGDEWASLSTGSGLIGLDGAAMWDLEDAKAELKRLGGPAKIVERNDDGTIAE